MYVCICKAINEKQVREAVKKGYSSTEDLSARLGLGIECGRCLPAAKKIIEQMSTTKPSRQKP